MFYSNIKSIFPPKKCCKQKWYWISLLVGSAVLNDILVIFIICVYISPESGSSRSVETLTSTLTSYCHTLLRLIVRGKNIMHQHDIYYRNRNRNGRSGHLYTNLMNQTLDDGWKSEIFIIRKRRVLRRIKFQLKL